MENENILMLRHHPMNVFYTNTFFTNQTENNLADYRVIDITSRAERNKEFMKERPARRPFGNTVLICEYPIDDTAAEELNAKLITWRLAKRAARDFLRVSFMPSAIVSAATHGGKTAVRVYGKY